MGKDFAYGKLALSFKHFWLIYILDLWTTWINDLNYVWYQYIEMII